MRLDKPAPRTFKFGDSLSMDAFLSFPYTDQEIEEYMQDGTLTGKIRFIPIETERMEIFAKLKLWAVNDG